MRSALLIALFGSSLLVAHHSVDAVFNRGIQKRFNGTVTKIEWLNPHAHFYLDVRGADGKVSAWEFQLGSPNGLMKHDWTRETLKKGDRVMVNAIVARDGSNRANVVSVILPDGREMPNYEVFGLSISH